MGFSTSGLVLFIRIDDSYYHDKHHDDYYYDTQIL